MSVKNGRAYRYVITETTGSGTRAIGDSPYVVDWSFFGRTYTWQIFDTKIVDVTGTYSGTYVDRGYLVDGKYRSDAEIAAATDEPCSSPDSSPVRVRGQNT